MLKYYLECLIQQLNKYLLGGNCVLGIWGALGCPNPLLDKKQRENVKRNTRNQEPSRVIILGKL